MAGGGVGAFDTYSAWDDPHYAALLTSLGQKRPVSPLAQGTPSYQYTSVPGQVDYGGGNGGVKVGDGSLEGTLTPGSPGGPPVVQPGNGISQGESAGSSISPMSLNASKSALGGLTSASSGNQAFNAQGETPHQVDQWQTDIAQQATALTNQQQADLAQKSAEQQYALSQQAADANMNRIRSLSNSFGIVGGGGGGGDLASVTDPNEAGARNAAFARAKDQQGLISRAALQGLREQMASRGLLGSGIESAGTGQVLGTAAGNLGDLTREQLINDFTRSGQIADRNYQGQITQRGQNMSMQQSLLGLLNAGQGRLY